MSDILSTRKIGDSAVTRPQVAGAATAATGTIANLPTALNSAAVGTLIKALVAAQTGRGLTTLETDKGTLVLQTNLVLKAGSEIVLQLQSTGPQNRFLILSVDKQPLSASGGATATTAPAANPATGAPGAPAGVAAPGGAAAPRPGRGNPAPITGGGTAAGIPRSSAETSVSRGPLTPGLVLPARVIVGTATPATATATAGTPQSAMAPKAAGTFATGDILTLRILGISPSGAAMPGAGNAPAVNDGQVMQGTVSPSAGAAQAQHRSGTPVASTEIALPEGRIAIAVTPPLAAGTRLQFEVLGAAHKPAATAPEGADGYRDFLRLGVEWTTAKETVAALRQDFPGSTAQTAPLIAEAGARMTSSLLFFMAALKSGDVRAWLGDARSEHLVQSGRGDLLARLGDDFAVLARHAGDAQPTGWHALAVPVDTGAHVEQFRLYYRNRKNSGDSDDRSTVTHFVVEADLSRIGLFRLEGMVRPRQFDLLVQSAQNLDGTMRDSIRSIFQDALNSGELAGTLRFEAGAAVPFNPGGAPARETVHATAVIA